MTFNRAAVDALLTDPDAAAIHRSLRYYYGDPGKDAAMDRFYAAFVQSGDLVFDVGAHVGDRIGSFRRLGARVVAVEPQPLCVRAIQEIYAGDPDVTTIEAICGEHSGTADFYVNSANPTVSTASPDFVKSADGAVGWADEVWDEQTKVLVTTLDELVRGHGVPAFIKIDVEGFEASVLGGLGQSVPSLSFEFTTIERPIAQSCLDRAESLGFDRFNVSMGDSMTLGFDEWVSAESMGSHIEALPHEANSGDIYCRIGR